MVLAPTDPVAPDPPATPAATVVIFRRHPAGAAPQLLMVQRASEMRFAGGAAVFPGGRVDPADTELAVQLGAADADAVEELAARIAAVRETIEETGLVIGTEQRVTVAEALAARALLLERGTLAPVLTAFGWTLAPGQLVPFARWLPRHRHVRVFDTRFYLHDLGTGKVEVLVDATENTRLFWASAAEALDLADSGQIRVIFPTRRNLERLAQFASFAEARDHAAQVPVRIISPRTELRGGEEVLTIPEDAGYPVTSEPLATAMRG